MTLLWVSINCRHEGYDDLADELLECTDDDGPWWFFYHVLASMIDRSKKRELLCLVMAIILMV